MIEINEVVSVIIPTYGRPENLKRAVSSVIRQTYKYWELVVVDDNNPNTKDQKETENIMKKFCDDNRIKYIKHEMNKNGSAARNTGINNSVGKYVAFLDDDDEYHHLRLEILTKKIVGIDTKKYAGVYTGCIFKKNGKKFGQLSNVKSGNFLEEVLACTFQMGSGSNLFITRNVINELEGFDEEFLRHQDLEFLVRLFEKYDILAENQELLIRHQTNTNVPNIAKLYEIKLQYLFKYKSIIDKFEDNIRESIYKCNYIQLTEAAIRTNYIQKAQKFYATAKTYGKINIINKSRFVLLYFRNCFQIFIGDNNGKNK